MKRHNKQPGKPHKYTEDITNYPRPSIIPTKKPPLPATHQTPSCDATYVAKSSPSNWLSIIGSIREGNIAEFRELLVNSPTPATILIPSPSLLSKGDISTIIDTIIRMVKKTDAVNYIQMIVDRHPSILENVNNILASRNIAPLTITPIVEVRKEEETVDGEEAKTSIIEETVEKTEVENIDAITSQADNNEEESLSTTFNECRLADEHRTPNATEAISTLGVGRTLPEEEGWEIITATGLESF